MKTELAIEIFNDIQRDYGDVEKFVMEDEDGPVFVFTRMMTFFGKYLRTGWMKFPVLNSMPGQMKIITWVIP